MRILMLALLLLFSLSGHAKTEVPITRLSQPPVIDGRMEDPAWQTVDPLPPFVTYRPEEGLSPSLNTEVRIGYDRNWFYIVFRCEIESPQKLKATVAPREGWESDEQVVFALDTYNTNREAFLFNFNPYGNPKDWISSTTGYSDMNWNIPLRTGARIYDDHYIVEVAIPFRSLPFDDSREEQRWGFYCFRMDETNGEFAIYPPRSRQIQNIFAQSGVLTGMHDIVSGNRLEIRPYLFSSRIERDRQWNFDTGVNALYAPTSTTILSATINPDYSQIESDPLNVDINQRDPEWLQEKRPFFTEGLDFFNVPNLNLVYTRNIVNPVAGVKFSGKFPGQSVGILSALDQGVDNDRNDLYNLFRYRRNIFGESVIGVAATQAEDLDSDRFNRVAAVDGMIVFPENIRIKTTGSYSWDGDGDVENRGGYAVARMEYERDNRWSEFTVKAASSDYIPGSGYISDFDRGKYMFSTHNSFPLVENHWRWESVKWFFGYHHTMDLSRKPLEDFLWTGIEFDWADQMWTELKYGQDHHRHEYWLDDMIAVKDMYTAYLEFETWKQWSPVFDTWLNGRVGSSPWFGSSSSDPGYEGWRYSLEGGFRWRAGSRLDLHANLEWVDFLTAPDGDRQYCWYTLWNRVTWMLHSRAHIRNIVQGRMVETHDLSLPGSTAEQETTWSTSTLFVWEYAPLSYMYLGVNFNNFDGFTNFSDETQIFLKINYLWMI